MRYILGVLVLMWGVQSAGAQNLPQIQRFERQGQALQTRERGYQGKIRFYEQKMQQYRRLASQHPRLRDRYQRLASDAQLLANRYKDLSRQAQGQQARLRSATVSVKRNPRLAASTEQQTIRSQNDLLRFENQVKQAESRFSQQEREIQRASSTGPGIQTPARPPARPTPVRPNPLPRPNPAATTLRLQNFSISRIQLNAPAAYQRVVGTEIQRAYSDLRGCYVRDLPALRAPASDRFAFSFQIQADGRVGSNRVARWPQASFKASLCMRDRINLFRFPLPPASNVLVDIEIVVSTGR